MVVWRQYRNAKSGKEGRRPGTFIGPHSRRQHILTDGVSIPFVAFMIMQLHRVMRNAPTLYSPFFLVTNNSFPVITLPAKMRATVVIAPLFHR
jgi:hypothetical protein